MPTLSRRPKHPAGVVVVCLESFGSSDPLGGCVAGTRLRGDHEKVIRWPQYFADPGLPDDELEELRKALYPDYQRVVV
jgi:hypothetical protein